MNRFTWEDGDLEWEEDEENDKSSPVKRATKALKNTIRKLRGATAVEEAPELTAEDEEVLDRLYGLGEKDAGEDDADVFDGEGALDPKRAMRKLLRDQDRD